MILVPVTRCPLTVVISKDSEIGKRAQNWAPKVTGGAADGSGLFSVELLSGLEREKKKGFRETLTPIHCDQPRILFTIYQHSLAETVKVYRDKYSDKKAITQLISYST